MASHQVPADLRYTKDHEWVRVAGETATIGITDFAQSSLGDIVFVDLPKVGDELNQHEVFGSIEAVKTMRPRSPSSIACAPAMPSADSEATR